MESRVNRGLTVLTNGGLLALSLAGTVANATSSVAYAEGGTPPSTVVNTSPNTNAEMVIYHQEISQIRTIGNWDKYDYIGSPTISRKVFIQKFVDDHSPLAKYAGAMYDECVRMGLDPNWFLAVAIEETSLAAIPGSDYRMDPCNVVSASAVLPSNIQVPQTNGISDFSRATVDGRPVTEEEAYILATRVCAANLHVQHDIVLHEKGPDKLARNTVWRETPPPINNTPLYWASMQQTMTDANEESLRETLVPQHRRIIVPLPALPDLPATPQNIAINQSVTPLPQPFASNIAA